MDKKIILLLLLVLLVPLISAKVYQVDEDMLISHSVRIGGYPSSSIKCNITVEDPDDIPTVFFLEMTNNATTQKHEYLVGEINKTGEWCYDLTCFGGGQNATESYCVEVTPNGILPTTAGGIFYIGIFAVLLLFLVLCIWGIVHFDNLVARFSLFQFLYLLIIAITFISYMLASDFITSAPFIISFFQILFWVVMVGFFPYVLIMFIWLGYSMITIKEIKDMMERGVPLDEAEARRKRKGRW